MLLNKLRSFIPAGRKERVSMLVLLTAVLVTAFTVSYLMAKPASTETKAGSITSSGRLADQNGKPVYEIELKKENKDPIDLLIKKDEYVQFNSKDGGQHQIVQGGHDNTEHAQQSLDSTVFSGDEGYLVQFKKTGKYEFHDNYDHDYTMTIIVYEPGAANKLK